MSSLKEKIAEAISEHIALEDTYTYQLTRVKSAFETGTISLEDFEEWTDENVDDLAGSIAKAMQLQLNDDQKVVLEWLKEEKTNSNLTAFDCIYSFIYGNPKDLITQIWSELNAKEEAQLLEVFSQWVQEQEKIK